MWPTIKQYDKLVSGKPCRVPYTLNTVNIFRGWRTLYMIRPAVDVIILFLFCGTTCATLGGKSHREIDRALNAPES